MYVMKSSKSTTRTKTVFCGNKRTAVVADAASAQTDRTRKICLSSSAAAATAAAAEAPPSTEDPQDECVLCCYPLPIRENESLYKECCGEVICRGCVIGQRRVLTIGTNVKKPIGGIHR